MATVNGTSGKDFIHVAGDGLVAPAGYLDTPLATNNADTITPGNGDDIVFAGGGGDTIVFNDRFTSADQVDGGAGSDLATLNGDYTGANAVVFAAATMVNVEKIALANGFSYQLTSNDTTVSSGGSLTVDASALGSAFGASFDGSAELDGKLIFVGGAGSDALTGGAKADLFDLSGGGNDIAKGGAGNDTFTLNAAMNAADQIDGGGGTADSALLSGDYSGANALVFGSLTLRNVETLTLTTGNAYELTFNSDNTVSAAKTLFIDGSTLDVDNALFVTAQAEGDGFFSITGGAGDDVLKLNRGLTATTTIDGGAGYDALTIVADYSGGFTLAATTLLNVELLVLGAGFNYTLTSTDATVVAGSGLTLDGSALGGPLHFDGSAETDGSFYLFGGAGDDTLTGGLGGDTFNLTLGGFEVAQGGGGDDAFSLGSTMTSSDTLDGGAGFDTVTIAGDYTGGGALGFAPSTMHNVEELLLADGHSYDLSFGTDDTIAAGQSLLVDGSTLGVGENLTLNAQSEMDGFFNVKGGAGDDTLQLRHGLNATTAINGGAGFDTLVVNADFSAGVVFSNDTLRHVEKVTVSGFNQAHFTLSDATIDAGQTLIVTRISSGPADSLYLDASAESDGKLSVSGNAGDDIVFGGAGDDHVSTGTGADEVHAGAGNDTLDYDGFLAAGDKADGGSGYDTLHLQGNYSAGVTFLAGTIANIEEIELVGGIASYKFTENDGNLTAAQTLMVDGSSLFSPQILTFNGAAELDGKFLLVGGTGDDVLTGGAQADTFDLSYGGNDIAKGGGGDDIFKFVQGSGFKAGDQLDGGAGSDTVELLGEYGANLVVMNATTLVNIETIKIDIGSSVVNLTTNDAAVAGIGQSLTVTYASNDVGDSLLFDGTAETNGKFVVTGAAGGDTIKTGGGGDVVNAGYGGNDTIKTGGGSDTINMGTAFTTGDQVDGGSGGDTMTLLGNYTLTFTAAMMTSIEVLKLEGRAGGSANFDLKMIDATVAAGLKVDASGATALKLDASLESSGNYVVIGSKAVDTIVTGLGNDSIQGGLGRDDLSAKGGNDVFVYQSVAESTNQTRDLLRDFITASDKFDLNVAVTAIDAAVTTGTLNEGSNFASNLAAAVGAAKLGAHHAVLFTASAGTLSGHEFLVVDANGIAGFQAGADYVMEINNPGIFGALSTANFI